MIDPKEEIEILRQMNRELMEENEHLRNQVKALEELAIDAKNEYNGEYLMRAWEEPNESLEQHYEEIPFLLLEKSGISH
jgi:regulator of replication initiation timing